MDYKSTLTIETDENYVLNRKFKKPKFDFLFSNSNSKQKKVNINMIKLIISA